MNIRKRTAGALIGLAISLSLTIAHAEPTRSGRRAPLPRTEAEVSTAVEGARHSVVVLERAGQSIALGFVLADDGRILTARSPLGDERFVEVRYADGGRARAHVEHADRAWDLALLTPERLHGSAREGLAASEAMAVHRHLAAFTASSRRLRAIPVMVRGRTTFLGKEVRRNEALELSAGLGPHDLGTPILDESGAVVALATRGCLLVEGGGGEACLPVPVGAPVAVLRAFLSSAPAAAPPTPWLGARVVADATPYARGVRIRDVQPASPAAVARLRGGPKEQADLVVAVDGAPVPSEEALSEAIRSRAVGESVTLLVLGQGQFREVPVVLRAAPPPPVHE